MENKVLWRGKPSHLLNLNIYMVCGLAFLASIIWRSSLMDFLRVVTSTHASLLYAFWLLLLVAVVVKKALDIEFHSYDITQQVLREKYGILNRNIHELELYRVLDTQIYAPFYLNICGYGTITLTTNDTSTPMAFLLAVKNPEAIRQLLREQVEIMRRAKGIVALSQ